MFDFTRLNQLTRAALLAAALAVLPACSNTETAVPTDVATPVPTDATTPAVAVAPTAPVATPAAVKPKPSAPAPDEPPLAAVSKHEGGWWSARQNVLNQRAQNGGFDVMFLGDSITHGWETRPPNGGSEVWREKLTPYRPGNFGIGGDETAHVLWRLRNGNLDGKADPKLVVLMIGTNDTAANRPARRIASTIKAIIEEIQTRKPNTKILLLAVFPRSPSAESTLRVNNGKINAIIQNFADNQRVFYKDIGALFIESDGRMKTKLLPDKLHPNAEGYGLWADAILPDIKRILGPDYALAPVPPPPPQPIAPNPEPRKKDKNWVARQTLLNQRAQEGGFDVMFIGDSITHAWENEGKQVWAEKLLPFKPQNFGISGDAVRHVLWRLRNGNLAGKADPKLVVIMIGTNDTGRKGQNDPRSTALGVRAIIDEIQKQKPATKVLLLGVFPRGHEAKDPARVTNAKINQLIKKYADNRRVFYKDLSPLFLEADGKISKTFKPDALHLTPEAYTQWADAILPDIERLLSASK